MYVIFLLYLCSRKGLTHDATSEFVYIIKNMSERELETKLRVGLQQTYRAVVEQHRRENQPLIFSENGEVVYVDPQTVEI